VTREEKYKDNTYPVTSTDLNIFRVLGREAVGGSQDSQRIQECSAAVVSFFTLRLALETDNKGKFSSTGFLPTNDIDRGNANIRNGLCRGESRQEG
jgi:hypothetical protein